VTDFLQEHPQGVILSMDQLSLYFQATLTRVWSPVGQTPHVWVTPQRRCCHFYGALNLRTGQDMVLPLPAQTTALTVHFLRHLLSCFPQQPILLLLDRAPWHRGQALAQLLKEEPRLQHDVQRIEYGCIPAGTIAEGRTPTATGLFPPSLPGLKPSRACLETDTRCR